LLLRTTLSVALARAVVCAWRLEDAPEPFLPALPVAATLAVFLSLLLSLCALAVVLALLFLFPALFADGLVAVLTAGFSVTLLLPGLAHAGDTTPASKSAHTKEMCPDVRRIFCTRVVEVVRDEERNTLENMMKPLGTRYSSIV
jgi:hypothetical protein